MHDLSLYNKRTMLLVWDNLRPIVSKRVAFNVKIGIVSLQLTKMLSYKNVLTAELLK